MTPVVRRFLESLPDRPLRRDPPIEVVVDDGSPDWPAEVLVLLFAGMSYLVEEERHPLALAFVMEGLFGGCRVAWVDPRMMAMIVDDAEIPWPRSFTVTTPETVGALVLTMEHYYSARVTIATRRAHRRA